MTTDVTARQTKAKWVEDASAFDVLDESWQASSQGKEDEDGKGKQGGKGKSDELRDSTIGELDCRDESSTERAKLPPSSSSLPSQLQRRRSDGDSNSNVLSKTIAAGESGWRRSRREMRTREHRRRSSGTMTDTELLQPGPSSPSRRKPSHQIQHENEDTLFTKANEDRFHHRIASSPTTSTAFHDLSSSIAAVGLRRPSPSLSSHSSEEKLEGKASTLSENQSKADLRNDEAETSDSGAATQSVTGTALDADQDRFGSAMEDVSTNDAVVTATEEATFIEHSNVVSPPQFMKQAWQKKGRKHVPKDIFGPTPLQALFLPPSPSRSSPQIDKGTDGTQTDEAGGIQSDVPERLAELDSFANKGGGPGPIEQQAVMPSQESEQSGEPKQLEELEEKFSRACLSGSDSGEAFPIAGNDELNEEKSDSPIEEGPATSTAVPQATFTFASPLAVPNSKRQPPTPSTSHAPLRLFHLRGRNPEVEQILNTPHSAAKAHDARKLVWKLVEEEGREERDKKRLRMDRIPSPVIPLSSLPSQLGEDARAIINPSLAETHGFIDRVRNLRHSHEGVNRTTSSLVPRRSGANAPTPERAVRYGRHLDALSGRRESPRKLLRRWSAANEVDEEIDKENDFSGKAERGAGMMRVPSLSVEPPPSPSQADGGADTSTSSVSPARMPTLTRSSEHPGMLQIAPGAVPLEEMEALSNGKMTFDREKGRWIRVRHLQKDHFSVSDTIADESSDPFRDMESTQVTRTAGREPEGQLHDRVDASFSLSRPVQQLVPPSAAAWSPNGFLTPAKSAPSDVNRSTPRSILKTGGSIKAKGRWPSDNQTTPTLTRQANRKISFADGINPRSSASKRREKMSELLHQLSLLAMSPDEQEEGEASAADAAEDDIDELPDQSLAASSLGRTFRTNASESGFLTPKGSTSQRPMPGRSPWGLSMLKASSRKREGDVSNASFLTNASFNVAHDRVLELLTDVAPWTTRWHDLRSIDLRGRRVESLVRIDEFLPQLEEALLDDNEISYLTGLPSSLRRLSIARNRLAPTTAFGHLANLESLDISNNHVDVKALRNLVRLRDLHANSNKITSIEGLQALDKLEKLHLRDNQIRMIRIAHGQWPNLQDLVLSRNQLTLVDGIGRLTHLRSLNLDHNRLAEVDLDEEMPRLKQLRVSGNNALHALDVGSAYNLRTLYADECALNEVTNVGMLRKLDNLSLRQQTGTRSLHWPAHEIRDVKRLFLSGNAFRAIDLSSKLKTSRPALPPPRNSGPIGITQFFGLIYLELSGCQLTSLPDELSEMVPNVRHLNADYNLFDNLPNLNKLHRLKRLSVVGCRIKRSRTLVESIRGCEELIFMDVRMNPCTLGLYPPIILAAPPHGAARTTKHGGMANHAFLPPVPHPLFAGPPGAGSRTDTKAASIPRHGGQSEEEGDGFASSAGRGMGSFGEKSFFHKRRPPPMLASTSTYAVAEEDSTSMQDGGDAKAPNDDPVGSFFAATDARFVRTLPPQFRLRRLLHRGSLAMACINLTWLDGLLIDEEEVRQADQHLRRRHSNNDSDDDGDDDDDDDENDENNMRQSSSSSTPNPSSSE